VQDQEFEAFRELDYPLELLEPLSFILASLLNRLCASLQARGKAAGRLHLQLKLEVTFVSEHDQHLDASPLFERTLSLPVPLSDTAALLKLLRLDLEAHPPQAPILAVRLRAEPAAPRVTQNDLFQPAAPEPARLEVSLARIAKLVGVKNVGSPELLDTHRPDAFANRPFRIAARKIRVRNFMQNSMMSESADYSKRLACRIFRPPLRTEVQCSSVGRPERLRVQGVCRNVVACAGPWLTSGDWWTLDPWQREEWDVELALHRKQYPASSPHTLYRVYRELRTDLWYVDASYD
jgi:protein ImuB